MRILSILFVFLFISTFRIQAEDPQVMSGRILIQYEDAFMGASKHAPGYNPIQNILSIMGSGPAQPFLDETIARRAQERWESTNKRAQTGNPHLENLRRTYVYDYIGDMDPVLLAAKISRMPGVAIAEPWYLAEIHARPSDEYVNTTGHDYFEKQAFFDAWEVTKGSSEIIIAIVDSGVDYTHPDLLTKAWVNQAEIPQNLRGDIDTNKDGKVSSLELHNWIVARNVDYNGDTVINLRDALHPSSPLRDAQDNDGNGFFDDIMGWDFWDSGYTTATVLSDNDPYGEFSLHGTHVAGLSAAETDNSLGVAGTGYLSRYMAIKAGGVRDNPATPNTNESNQIGFGYQGIIYAAINGAHIINNSWGGGGYSEINRNVIRFANSLGSVVVASAGNSGSFTNSYPGAYPESINVASSDYDGVPIGRKSSFSTYNSFVDVMATGSRGPGLGGVLSTYRGSSTQSISIPTAYSYAFLQGTSMAAPIVSGLAALVRAKNPTWTPERIASQIRVTSVMADELNPSFAGNLGRGYINAYAAVVKDMPGYTVLSADLVNEFGVKATVGEKAFMRYKIVNHGSKVPVTAKLSTTSSGFTVNSTDVQVSSATGDTIYVDFPATLNRLTGQIPSFKIEFANEQLGYYDFNFYNYDSIYLDDIENNNIITSLNTFGNVGAINSIGGVGVTGFNVRMNNTNQFQDVVFEGGLMVTSRNFIADRVRDLEQSVASNIVPMSPFSTQIGGDNDAWTHYGKGDARLRLRSQTNFLFVDTTMTVRIEGYTYDRPDISKVMFLKYTLKNGSTTLADTTYIGMYNDIDVGALANSNSAEWSAADSILYVHSPNEDKQPYVAIVPVGNTATALAIDNAATGTGLNFGLFDGFSAAEKVRALRAGRQQTTVLSKDVSTVVASGPYHIMPNQQVVVGFLYAYGNTLAELRAQVAAARALKWIDTTPPGMVLSDENETPEVPFTTSISGNYPNPFNPTTTISFELAQSGQINLSVYNVLGQRVAQMFNGYRAAGRYNESFDASRLGSGVYFVRMHTGSAVYTHKMTLIK
jgi:subtilisin family serine protease